MNRVYAQIDLDAILFNMESMYRNIRPGTRIAAVIKTDGYGHGAKEIASVLEDVPYVWGYAVATADEALELRQSAIKKPILILGLIFEEQLETLISEDIRITVCEYRIAEKLSKAALASGKNCYVHIKIDTGMGRIGFPANEKTLQIVEQIAGLPNMIIEGVFTHFAAADEADKESALQQLALFSETVMKIEERGIAISIHHCSNSAGIIDIPSANMDMVRAGITLYGLWPSEEVQKNRIPLRPVMSLKSHISFLKNLEAGNKISYGGIYVTKRSSRIATIPVGYGDGYCRGLSNKGYVLIHGKKAPVCGRICMDQFMVDVTDIPEAKEGDLVTLLGKDGASVITMEELGTLSGRFNYEFACLITSRVPRIYVQNGRVLSIRNAFER